MIRRWHPVLISLVVLVLQACAAPRDSRDIVEPRHQTPETVMGLLDKHVIELSRNIAGLSDRIADIKNLPETPDPTIRELRALDLAGWELHQQQWILQREHLTYARTQLQEATGSSRDKSRIREEWAKHEQAFEAAMADFRQQRQLIEQKRLQVEAQLIDRYLR